VRSEERFDVGLLAGASRRRPDQRLQLEADERLGVDDGDPQASAAEWSWRRPTQHLAGAFAARDADIRALNRLRGPCA
jgi:hypothetical protein